MHLSNASLTSLPGSLFSLTNLTVLSLRNNNLKEVPDAIQGLTNLKEFHVGSNQLRFLPYSLLSLSKLIRKRRGRLTVHPNPFLRQHPLLWTPPTSPSEKRHWVRYRKTGRIVKVKLSSRKHDVLVSTPTSFLDVRGQPLRTSAPRPSTTQCAWLRPSDVESETSAPPDEVSSRLSEGGVPSRVPSLTELCLRALLSEPSLPQLTFIMPPEFPRHKHLLKKAYQVREASCETRPAQKCTICGNSFIIPRTEWMEWHGLHEHKDNSMSPRLGKGSSIPFLRQGCSWGCRPPGPVVAENDAETHGKAAATPRRALTGWRAGEEIGEDGPEQRSFATDGN